MRKIHFCGHELDHPIMNAAGTCKTLEDVKKFATSAVAVVTVGSGTEDGSSGNPGNTWHAMEHNTINSIGLTNPGETYYHRHLPEMVKIAHDHGKPLIYSTAGNTPEQFRRSAQMALNCGVDFAELNKGCPNKWHDGQQGQILSFQFDVMGETLSLFSPSGLKRCGVKISPYSDPTMRHRLVTEVLLRFPTLGYLASSNTFPNAFGFQENWRPAIDSPNVPTGFGGGAGPGFKEFVLGQNREILLELDKHPALRDLPLIGIGGADSGRAVLEHCRCGMNGRGASLVGVASAYFESNENLGIFSRMLGEYADILAQEEEE